MPPTVVNKTMQAARTIPCLVKARATRSKVRPSRDVHIVMRLPNHLSRPGAMWTSKAGARLMRAKMTPKAAMGTEASRSRG